MQDEEIYLSQERSKGMLQWYDGDSDVNDVYMIK
jgi:hypothetical protein